MPVNDDLGKRMKENYEMRARSYLTRRMPVAIRLDGAHFHTFTKGMKKPFDNVLITAMQNTMRRLCQNVQGCVFGYTQSDEITLILVDYKNLNSEAWFDYQVQKICSTAAALATLYFNQEFEKAVEAYNDDYCCSLVPQSMEEFHNFVDYIENMRKKSKLGATFDARCFNIPKEEVVNLVYWRQLDAIRNSIQMCGQARYSQKQLNGASCAVIKEMLRQDGFDWDAMLPYHQYGSACYYDEHEGWIIDKTMPVLKGVYREYLERLINFD